MKKRLGIYLGIIFIGVNSLVLEASDDKAGKTVAAETGKNEKGMTLVNNPGFEIIDPSDSKKPLGWKTVSREGNPGFSWGSDERIASKVISIRNLTRKDWGIWESAPVPVNPRTKYLLRLRYRCHDTLFGAAEVLVDSHDIYLRQLPLEWTDFEQIIITGEKTTTLTIGLTLYHRAGQQVWFDDVKLIEWEKIPSLELPLNNAILYDISPDFRWQPVKEARHYIFQYSQDNKFEDSSVVSKTLETNSFIPDQKLIPGTWFWRVGASAESGDTNWSRERSFLITKLVEPIKEDTTPPVLLILSPVPDTKTGKEAAITLEYSDPGSGIDVATASLKIDDQDVTKEANITDSKITYAPSRPFSPGIHKVTAEIADKAGNVSNRARWQFAVDAEIPAGVEIQNDNSVLANGLPFFPVGLYSYSTNWKERSEAGFNTALSWSASTNYFNTLLSYQQKAYAEVPRLNELKGSNEVILAKFEDKFKKEYGLLWNHPALLVYFYDEPDNMPLATMSELQKIIKRSDIRHPVTWNLCQPSSFNILAESCDIISTDPYPLPGSVTTACDYLEQAKGSVKDKKPVWLILQAFDWDVAATGKIKDGDVYHPTPAEERAMTYLTINHGAKGLIFYASDEGKCNIVNFPKEWKALKSLATELRHLTPVILTLGTGESVNITPKDVPVDCALKVYQGNRYLFAVNTSREPRAATFKLPHLGSKSKIKVLFEDRVIKPEETFSDVFRPLEAHIYEISGDSHN